VRDFFFEPAKGIEITRKDFGKRLGKVRTYKFLTTQQKIFG
jgi:hypothetical protein